MEWWGCNATPRTGADRRGSAHISPRNLRKVDRGRVTDNLRLEIAPQTRYSRRYPHGGFDVMHDRPDPNEAHESAQVLRFQRRRRAGQQPPRGSATAANGSETEPIDDLARYEEEDSSVDYRHRMMMNFIAVLIVAALVGAGVWIADTITDMEKAQDCVMQGRQNCAPIELPAPKR